MDWKKPLRGKNHADDFQLNDIKSAYNLNAKSVIMQAYLCIRFSENAPQ